MPPKTVKEILSTRFPKDLLWTSFNLFQAFLIFCRNSSAHLPFYQFTYAAQVLAALTENMSLILFLRTTKRQQQQSDCPTSRWFNTNSAASWSFPLSPVGVSASSAMSKETRGQGNLHPTPHPIQKHIPVGYSLCMQTLI